MCINVAQLRLLENTLVTLKELAKEQEERQLERILWYTGAKMELQQQEAYTEGTK